MMLNSQDVEIIRNTVIEVLEPRLLASEDKMDKKIDGKLVALEGRIDGKLVAMEHRIVTSLENKIDEKIDELALITKHGFDEVHTRLDNLEHRLEKVEEIVLPTGYSVSVA